MPAGDFVRWMAYYNLEPFGSWRDNFHFATLCALTANIHRDPKKPALSFQDFMFEDATTARQRKNRTMMQRFRARAKNG